MVNQSNAVETKFKFKAKITYERYYNEDTNWGVYVFVTTDDIPEYLEYQDPIVKLPDEQNYTHWETKQKMSTLCGKMQRLFIGTGYEISATCEFNNKYNTFQYIPVTITALVPTNIEESRTFLESICSTAQADVLITTYPNIVNDVINNCENVDLHELKGIGRPTWERIKENILNNYVISDILILLQPLGVTYKMIQKLLMSETNPALLKQMLLENPYIMTKIKGIGFKRIDSIALKLLPEMKISKHRVHAFIKYYLNEIAEGEGHTWITLSSLAQAIKNNIPECYDLFKEIVQEKDKENKNNNNKQDNDNNNETNQELKYLYIDVENNKVGLQYYYNIEHNIVDILTSLNNYEKKWDVNIEEGIQKAEKEQGFTFTDEQKQIIAKATQNNVIFISGKAGCVDKETEFFDGTQWKSINSWKAGDKVLQYNADGTTQLVTPLNYIKQHTNYLWLFRRISGLSQCLSDDHIVIYKDKNKSTSLHSIELKNVKAKQEIDGVRGGFHGRFITTFKYHSNRNYAGLILSDSEVKIMAVLLTEGILINEQEKTYQIAVPDINNNIQKAKDLLRRVTSSYKMDTKIIRDPNNLKTTKIITFTFVAPLLIEDFKNDFYKLHQRQFKIFRNQFLDWHDINMNDDKLYAIWQTTDEKIADMLQFAFSTTACRAIIKITQDKTGDEVIEHYNVYASNNIFMNFTTSESKEHNKTRFIVHTTRDGFEYCFTVPSHMLVLRRSGNIFITGNCGKTTITRAILKIYDKYQIGAVALSAKAAQRITEATGYPASTIHRFLGFNKESFTYNANNKLPHDIILIDESSMISADLFHSLLVAVKEGAKIIMCGDNRQLPPIGAGNIFSDFLENQNHFNMNKLTKVLRQAEKSGITVDANKIREGISPIENIEPHIVNGELRDMAYIFKTDKKALQETAINTFLKNLDTYGLNETVIIVPRKNNCENSTNEMNRIIQDKLIGNNVPQIKYGDKVFKLGAKVVQKQNNYEKNVVNVEMGYITKIGYNLSKSHISDDVDNKDTKDKSKTEQMEITFTLNDQAKPVIYNVNELQQIDLGYALTIHSAQGGGFKLVICVIDNSHYILLDNCLLYTAITRAKEKCLLLAEPEAFNRCLYTNKSISRQTWINNDIFLHI